MSLKVEMCVLTAYLLYIGCHINNILKIFAAIVEKNPLHFRLDNNELLQRKSFIQQTRSEISAINEKLQIMKGRDTDGSAHKVLLPL